jgi:hypothetical protein
MAKKAAKSSMSKKSSGARGTSKGALPITSPAQIQDMHKNGPLQVKAGGSGKGSKPYR